MAIIISRTCVTGGSRSFVDKSLPSFLFKSERREEDEEKKTSAALDSFVSRKQFGFFQMYHVLRLVCLLKTPVVVEGFVSSVMTRSFCVPTDVKSNLLRYGTDELISDIPFDLWKFSLCLFHFFQGFVASCGSPTISTGSSPGTRKPFTWHGHHSEFAHCTVCIDLVSFWYNPI